MTVRRVASWNCKVGRGDDAVGDGLRELIADHDPDVICLQEGMHYVDMLRHRFDGWFVYARGGWPESDNCPVMVRKNGREKKEYGDGFNTLRYTTKWVGPQGGAHDGRTWTYVNVDGITVMSLHRCTGGKDKNAEAFYDEYQKLTAFLKDREKPVVIFGDHNCGPSKTFKGASKNVATDTESKISHDGGIDYVIRRGIKGTVKHGKAYGSDHECAVFTVTE